jgi:hypothetical protein
MRRCVGSKVAPHSHRGARRSLNWLVSDRSVSLSSTSGTHSHVARKEPVTVGANGLARKDAGPDSLYVPHQSALWPFRFRSRAGRGNFARFPVTHLTPRPPSIPPIPGIGHTQIEAAHAFVYVTVDPLGQLAARARRRKGLCGRCERCSRSTAERVRELDLQALSRQSPRET